MPLTNCVSAVLQAMVAGGGIGCALVLVISLALKFLAPANAATRALVWLITLAALLVIPFAYFVSHNTHAGKPPSTVASVKAADTPARKSIAAPTAAFAEPETAPIEIPAPPNAAASVVAVYLAIAGCLLVRLLFGFWRVRRLRRRSHPASAVLLKRFPAWLERCPTSRSIALRLSSEARSPLAIGWNKPMIVIPEALVLELSGEELDDLGVHELAHLRRFDDWTNLFQRLLQALLFFHPGAWYASGKLSFEREVACDDWVLRSRGAKSYARCLARVAELRSYRHGALLLSSGAFSSRRGILRRVENMLDKTRDSATRISGLTLAAVLVILIVIAVQVVHLPSVVAFTEAQQATTSLRITDGSRNLRISSRGDVTFTADEGNVASISPDGFILIDEEKDWSHRRLEVRPNSGGEPEEHYFLNGREKQMDGVGRVWSAGIYLMLLREVGIDAEGRADRILAARGPEGLLAEVDLIHSDSVKRQYLSRLMNHANLSISEMQRVADSIRKMGSDSDKADFLLEHQHEFASDELRPSYFRAASSIRSDDDRRRVLAGALDTGGKLPEDAFFAAANTMQSSGERADVLLKLLRQAAISNYTYRGVANSAKGINSDDDKANVLTELAAHYSGDGFFEAASTIASSSDRARVLRAVLEHAPATPALLQTVESAEGLGGDNEKADVLIAVAKQNHEPEVTAALRKACQKIGGDSDYRRVASVIFEASN